RAVTVDLSSKGRRATPKRRGRTMPGAVIGSRSRTVGRFGSSRCETASRAGNPLAKELLSNLHATCATRLLRLHFRGLLSTAAPPIRGQSLNVPGQGFIRLVRSRPSFLLRHVLLMLSLASALLTAWQQIDPQRGGSLASLFVIIAAVIPVAENQLRG